MSLFYHGKQLFELRYKGFLHVILGEAFGDKYFTTIPRESPVAWYFTVKSVE
jgi:hypothetical protein